MPVLSRLRSLASFVLAFAALSSFAHPSRVHALNTVENWTPEFVKRLGYGSEPVWRDEFNGDALDLTKWDPKDDPWPHNGEKQYYSPSAVTVSDGKLKIRASKEERGGRPYTSGRIDTSQSTQFQYGLYAARIKSTYSQGVWPAWWLFGTGPKYSELDMFEQAGGDAALLGEGASGDDSSYAALTHFSVVNRPTDEVSQGPVNSFKVTRPEKFSDNFHVMWMEWTPTELWFGLDDWSQLNLANISQLDAFNAHMYMIFNVAIGGDYPGDPDSTTVMPQTLEVDWVRVWAKGGRGEDILQHEKINDNDGQGGQSEQPTDGGSNGGSSGGESSSSSSSTGGISSSGVPSTGGSSSDIPSSSSSSGPSDGSSDGSSSAVNGSDDNDSSSSGDAPDDGNGGDIDGSSGSPGGGSNNGGSSSDNAVDLGAASILQASGAIGLLGLVASVALML